MMAKLGLNLELIANRLRFQDNKKMKYWKTFATHQTAEQSSNAQQFSDDLKVEQSNTYT